MLGLSIDEILKSLILKIVFCISYVDSLFKLKGKFRDNVVFLYVVYLFEYILLLFGRLYLFMFYIGYLLEIFLLNFCGKLWIEVGVFFGLEYEI